MDLQSRPDVTQPRDPMMQKQGQGGGFSQDSLQAFDDQNNLPTSPYPRFSSPLSIKNASVVQVDVCRRGAVEGLLRSTGSLTRAIDASA